VDTDGGNWPNWPDIAETDIWSDSLIRDKGGTARSGGAGGRMTIVGEPTGGRPGLWSGIIFVSATTSNCFLCRPDRPRLKK